MRLSLFLVAAFTFALTACAWLGPKDGAEDATKPDAPKLIGRIASVPADRRFVLIQIYGAGKPDAGSVLTTRGLDGRAANLLVTGESMGEFAAADVQSGALEIGDGVYSQHVPKPADTSPAAAPEAELPDNQQKSPLGNVQKNN